MNTDSAPPGFRHPGFDGRIGFARADITPPIGIYARNWGAAAHDLAESLHRPLNLTAMVVSDRDAGQQLVLLEGDLGWWRGLDVWARFQARLLTALRLEPESLIFSLTHSHSAPPLMHADPRLPGGALPGVWLDSILETSIAVVAEATARREPAALEWHTGCCRLAQTRDLASPEPPTGRRICGFDPSRQADSTLLLGRATDAEGKIMGVLVNYACHPTTLAFDNRSISPDYVGEMRATIEREIGGAPALFLQGASGELAPRYQYVSDTEVADRHGRQLGFAALATLADMEPPRTVLSFDHVVESGAPLAIWRHRPRALSPRLAASCHDVPIPLKDWPSAKSLEDAHATCQDRTLKERLKRKLAIRRALGDDDHYALPFWVWRMGEAIWVGSSAESYSVFQTTLRNRFPQTALVCLNLINGSIGYLPPDELYDEDVYQVWQTPFDRGGLEQAIETMTSVIARTIEEE